MCSPGRRKSRGETDPDALIPLQPPPATAKASKNSADKAIRFGFIPSRIAQRDKHSKAHSVSEFPARDHSKDMIFRVCIGKCDPRTEKSWKAPRLAGRRGRQCSDIGLSDAARVNLLPLPARNERGGMGRGETRAKMPLLSPRCGRRGRT